MVWNLWELCGCLASRFAPKAEENGATELGSYQIPRPIGIIGLVS